MAIPLEISWATNLKHFHTITLEMSSTVPSPYSLGFYSEICSWIAPAIPSEISQTIPLEVQKLPVGLAEEIYKRISEEIKKWNQFAKEFSEGFSKETQRNSRKTFWEILKEIAGFISIEIA